MRKYFLILVLCLFLIGVSLAVPTEENYQRNAQHLTQYVNAAGLDWSVIHDAASGSAVQTNTDVSPIIRCDGITNKWDNFGRVLLGFNTSAIPDDKEVLNVSLRVYVNGVWDGWGDKSIDLVYAFPTSSPYDTTDYDSFGSNVLATKPISSISAGWNWFNFTDDGTISKTGTTYLGLRVSSDTANSEPAWTSGRQSYITIDYTPNLARLYVIYDDYDETIYLTQTLSSSYIVEGDTLYLTQNTSEGVYNFGEVLYDPLGSGTYDSFGWFNDTLRDSITFTLSDIDAGSYIFHSYVYNGTRTAEDNTTFTVLAEPTPTPTINQNYTQTVTATPTPRPVTCSYWSAALSSSSIPRGGNTTVTLTEADPSDNFDKIEYIKVLPNGQEIPQYYFINDPGFFGLGAGWVKVDPLTDTASASSLSEAKSYLMSFSVSGENHIKVNVYDDKSLLRSLYTDYELVCGMILDVHVGGTTSVPDEDYPGPDGIDGTDDDTPYEWGPDGLEGTDDDITYYTPQIGINVWEADTKAIVYDTTICVQDRTTGAWENQSNQYGQTVYFYANPGQHIRIYVNKSPWSVFDQTITVPNPPGTYGVYLTRPISQETGYSWVVFAVKEANTLYPLSGAYITLDTGANVTTNGAGGAQFNLTEGETVYYTISKYGYHSTTGYITVPADDYYPTVVLNRDTSITLYTPIPTGTSQVIGPTATGTLAPGGNGSIWIPGGGGGGATAVPTLDTLQRAERTEQGLSIWYANLPALSGFFLLMIIIGGFGMMTESFNFGGRRRRR
jgi:hypothetical protein